MDQLEPSQHALGRFGVVGRGRGPQGDLIDAERVAGGRSESVFQPEWSPDGVLHFVSDRTGWWNLYRLKEGRVEALCPREAEFGLPQWVFWNEDL